MTEKLSPIQEVPGLYKIIPLIKFRRTKGVAFDLLPIEFIPKIDGIDRVIHDFEAISPGKTAGIERPWYMHPAQADNLIVLHGIRYVDIYTKEHGKIESFEVSANMVKHNGEIVYQGPVMLVWSEGVFHRIQSGEKGSASLNFAVRGKEFDIETNFNIYDLDTNTGEYKVLREGHLDQF
jgi:predicted dehydrogenase